MTLDQREATDSDTAVASIPRQAHDPVARFAVSVEVVVLSVDHDELRVLMLTRTQEPERRALELPSAFLGAGEEFGQAAKRIAHDVVGLSRIKGHLEQVSIYSPGAHSRGRDVIDVVYVLYSPGFSLSETKWAAGQIGWYPVSLMRSRSLQVAFDHKRIISDAVDHVRIRIENTMLAAEFCGRKFTVTELRRIYEAVWDCELDAGNFHRKLQQCGDLLTFTGRTTPSRIGPPAAVYRVADPAGSLIHPAFLRPEE